MEIADLKEAESNTQFEFQERSHRRSGLEIINSQMNSILAGKDSMCPLLKKKKKWDGEDLITANPKELEVVSSV